MAQREVLRPGRDDDRDRGAAGGVDVEGEDLVPTRVRDVRRRPSRSRRTAPSDVVTSADRAGPCRRSPQRGSGRGRTPAGAGRADTRGRRWPRHRAPGIAGRRAPRSRSHARRHRSPTAPGRRPPEGRTAAAGRCTRSHLWAGTPVRRRRTTRPPAVDRAGRPWPHPRPEPEPDRRRARGLRPGSRQQSTGRKSGAHALLAHLGRTAREVEREQPGPVEHADHESVVGRDGHAAEAVHVGGGGSQAWNTRSSGSAGDGQTWVHPP